MKDLFSILVVAILAVSCEDRQSEFPEWPWGAPDVEGDTSGGQDELPLEDATLDKWSDVSENYGELPEYIKVYKSPLILVGKKAVAYIAVADLSKGEWDIWSISDPEMDGTDEPFKTPAKVYSEGNWPIVINAGFFYSDKGVNYSSSLAVRDSETLTFNINYASEDWITIYNPTRAALLEREDGSFDACWTYKTYDSHFMYPEPSANSWASDPADLPSADYPEGGEVFSAETAIGGGPLLIDEGKFKDTYVEELFNGTSGIGPDTNQPRTAIGVTSDRKMILFVCEGRNMTEGVAGLTTADVADILLDLNCVEAINLDGGGSSCMLVNGIETIQVSDGAQRAVGSTIMLR